MCIRDSINNVLKETGLEGADAFDKALLLNALGKLEAAEHSDEYKDVITGELEKLVENDNISIGENDLVNYMYGNACYSVGKNDIAVNIAKQTETQPRTESGYFTGAEGGRCLCTCLLYTSYYNKIKPLSSILNLSYNNYYRYIRWTFSCYTWWLCINPVGDARKKLLRLHASLHNDFRWWYDS